ncbi:myoneurin-like isoform X1 [Eurosta solidaginis]|uniref:myoneurin-like isoform X1 n=1 Tax=Eurosta solidaginis TaxID=178769 RepID=UPI003530AADC
MAQVIIKSELNYADFRKCGEISALMSEDKHEFYINCGFCEFMYLHLNDLIQHIYDDHFLEFQKQHVKQERSSSPVNSEKSADYYGLENIVEVNLGKDLEGTEASENLQDTDFLSNYETDLLDTNDAVSNGGFSQDSKHEENLNVELDIHNDVENDLLEEIVSDSKALQNKINSKRRRTRAQNIIDAEASDVDSKKELDTPVSNRNQNESKPVTKEIKITDTILNVAQCILLSATYKEYTCLWNEQDIAYRFKNRRNDAFKSVRENFNEKSGLHLTEHEFEREVLRLRKICTYEKKQKIVCKKKNIEYKSSCAYYDHLEYLEVDVAPFVCSICGEQYPALGKLKVHVASHDGSLPFKCNICGHGFQLGCNLTTHLRRHAQDYTYYCEVCNKGWATSTDKKMHMRIHTGEKPYVCYTCGSSFATASRLAEHIRTRHKQRRCYKCEICSKAFYTSKVLNEHKKSHLNVREHVCEICEKAFKSDKHLKQHKRIHDSEKRCICKICGKRFAQSAGLCAHMKAHGARTTKNDIDNN